MFYWVIKLLAWPFRQFYFRAEAEGVENLPVDGGVIVVANHASFLDAGVLGSVLPRKIHFVVLSRMLKLRRLRWFYIGMETIAVNRDAPEHAAVRRSLQVLRGGGVLGIFPEGGRSRSGELGNAQEGAALLAQKSGAPVVPVGISGAYEAFPPGSRFPRPRKIRARVGAPFYYPGTGRRADRAGLQAFSRRIMEEIAAQLPEGSVSSASTQTEEIR
jgi:1-acyl-sn-glycerol-3-phosphate acyltransferase